MKTILLILLNRKITDNISELKNKKNNIVILNNIEFLNSYLEEYLPYYIILSSKIKNFEKIISFINRNTWCELIITDSSGKRTINNNLKNIKNIRVGEIKNINDLEKILKIIEKIEKEKTSVNEKGYKFINQQIISFYSVQGGVGKTTMAFNTAWFLKNLVGSKILIIDLNFCEGPSDLSVSLNLPLAKNLNVFINKISDGYNALSESMVSLKNIDIDIIQPPLSIYQSDKFSIDMLNSLIYLARNNYNFIIADIPFRYNNTCLEMLNLSTVSFIILSPGISSILRVNDFQKFLPDVQKKGVIINQVRNEEIKNVKEIKTMINVPVYEQIFYLPEEKRRFIRCGNQVFNILDFQSKISNLSKVLI